MGRLLVMVASDLRQQVLDRSILIFGLVVPLALMWVFSLVFAPLTEELEPITVAVSAPADDPAAQAITQALGSLGEEGFEVAVVESAPQELPALLADGEVGAALEVPQGFGAAVTAGEAPEVTLELGGSAGTEGTVVASVVDEVLRQLTATGRTAAAAGALGADGPQIESLVRAEASAGPAVGWSTSLATVEELTPREAIVAGQAGFFLLFTVGFGVLGLVVEREWGTLSRLVSMPIPTWWVPLSKGLSSWVLGVLATGVLLAAGTVFFDDVDLGSPPVVAVLVMGVVAAATSIMFLIAKVARTAEQAGVAQTIVAVTLGMSGGSFFRVDAEGLLGQVLLLNPVSALSRGLDVVSGGGGVVDLAPVLLAMLLFTVVMLALAALTPGRTDVL